MTLDITGEFEDLRFYCFIKISKTPILYQKIPSWIFIMKWRSFIKIVSNPASCSHYKSIFHNKAIQGENAPVLAYTYFYLSEVMAAKALPYTARYYREKSLAIAKYHGLTNIIERMK